MGVNILKMSEIRYYSIIHAEPESKLTLLLWYVEIISICNAHQQWIGMLNLQRGVCERQRSCSALQSGNVGHCCLRPSIHCQGINPWAKAMSLSLWLLVEMDNWQCLNHSLRNSKNKIKKPIILPLVGRGDYILM